MNQTRPIAHYWIILASVCLLVSGLLSIIVTGAKASGIKELITNVEVIRWFLVIHVNLSSLVWFTALPVGLIHMTGNRTDSNIREKLGLTISVVGLFMMLSVPPQASLEIVLANYVPILAHPRYYAALILYVLGVAISMATLQPLYTDLTNRRWAKGLSEIGFGLSIGTLIFFVALATTAFSFRELKSAELITTLSFFEVGMWGGGHLLQHASATFMICCWVLLLTAETGQPPLARRELFPIFAWLSLPIFIAPLLLKYSIMTADYRQGFTMLMQWGIAPAILAFLFLSFRRLPKNFLNPKKYLVASFVCSAFLVVMGFVFGAFINGADMRVPGHYHASIGAVSLTLMATAFYLLSRDSSHSKWMLRSVWTYGIGQSLFASGMFVAGTFGMSRKTYGSEHTFEHLGQTVGFLIMAIGGFIALTGGLFFAIAIYPYLRPQAPASDT